MTLRIVSDAEVEQLLPMRECIEAMAKALLALDEGDIAQPLRVMWTPPNADQRVLTWMPAFESHPQPLVGMKVLCVVRDNRQRRLDRHQGLIVLIDGTTGQALFLASATAITGIRTAAVSALATRVLAREDANDLAIVGAGVQARRHLESIALVRDLRRTRVTSRTLESAQAFARQNEDRFSFPIEAVESTREAIRDADIVVTATDATEPVLHGAWVAPGTHLNVVGASVPSRREIDDAAVAAATLFVDRRESVEHEAGEYRRARKVGTINASHVRAELGEVLAGRARGRTSADEITLYRSLGLAAQDLAAAEHVLRRAQAADVGTTLEL